VFFVRLFEEKMHREWKSTDTNLDRKQPNRKHSWHPRECWLYKKDLFRDFLSLYHGGSSITLATAAPAAA
jgi:hypothetical protein